MIFGLNISKIHYQFVTLGNPWNRYSIQTTPLTVMTFHSFKNFVNDTQIHKPSSNSDDWFLEIMRNSFITSKSTLWMEITENRNSSDWNWEQETILQYPLSVRKISRKSGFTDVIIIQWWNRENKLTFMNIAWLYTAIIIFKSHC